MTGDARIPDNGSVTPILQGSVTPKNTRGSEVVRRAAEADLKACGISRGEVAARLSEATGQAVSVAMIDAYLAETKPHKFPAELLPAWVQVTGSRRMLDAIAAEVGLSLATEEDREFADLGRTKLRAEKLHQRLWSKV